MKRYLYAWIAAAAFLALLVVSAVLVMAARGGVSEQRQAIAKLLEGGNRRVKEGLDKRSVTPAAGAEAAASLEQARRRLDDDGEFDPKSLRSVAAHLDAGEDQLVDLAISLSASKDKFQIAIGATLVCVAGCVISGILGIVLRRKKVQAPHFAMSQEGSDYLTRASQDKASASEAKATDSLSDPEKE
jgi:hypothetical protein